MATTTPPRMSTNTMEGIRAAIAAKKKEWEAEAEAIQASLAAMTYTETFNSSSVMTAPEFYAITPNPNNTTVDGALINLKIGPIEVITQSDKIIVRQNFTKAKRVKTTTVTQSILGDPVGNSSPAIFDYRTQGSSAGGYTGPYNGSFSPPETWESLKSQMYPTPGKNIRNVRFYLTNPTFNRWYFGVLCETQRANGTWDNADGIGYEASGAANLFDNNTYNVNSTMHILHYLEDEETTGYRDFTISLAGLRNTSTGQTSPRTPSNGSSNPSGGSQSGRRPGGTYGGSSNGGTFYNSSTGQWGNTVISNDTISTSPYTEPIDGLNTSTKNNLPGDVTLTMPPASFILQTGSIGEVHPLYQGSLVFDLELKKWGKSRTEFLVLLDFMPINAGLTGQVAASDFDMKMGQLDSLGEIRLYDQYPEESWIRYGKAGYYRLGHTEMLETKVHFRYPANATIEIDSSMDGRNIDPSLNQSATISGVNEYTFKYKTNGRWFTISLFGQWDLQFMELRGNITGRR